MTKKIRTKFILVFKYGCFTYAYNNNWFNIGCF